MIYKIIGFGDGDEYKPREKDFVGAKVDCFYKQKEHTPIKGFFKVVSAPRGASLGQTVFREVILEKVK